MTNYEQTKRRIEALEEAGRRCIVEGKYFMASMWEHKRAMLANKLAVMTVEEAEKCL